MKKFVRKLIRSQPKLANCLWRLMFPVVRQRKIIRQQDVFESTHQQNTSRAGIFTEVYSRNAWANDESVSGWGSTLDYTIPIREELPSVLTQLAVRSLLDAPCGDLNWMLEVEFPHKIDYLGADVVPDLIADLEREHGSTDRTFQVLDIVTGPIPSADFWLCRDVLFHMPFADGLRVLKNAAEAEVDFFASTTFDFVKVNHDAASGDFRFINLLEAPYILPKPVLTIDDFLAPNPPRVLAIWSRDMLRSRFGLD